MGELILSLVPLALGILLSPLAIMALVAVLLSRSARPNGIAFLLGWVVAVAIILIGSLIVFHVLEVHEQRTPPVWVLVLRLVLGLILLLAAVHVYRKGRKAVHKMANAVTPAEVGDAAPQLPGWITVVGKFTPLRSYLLGLGVFVLNPVSVSCTLLAALEIRSTNLAALPALLITFVFALLAIAPIAAPVIFTLIRREMARPFLDATQEWIVNNTKTLNAIVLLVIAVLQFQKTVSGFAG